MYFNPKKKKNSDEDKNEQKINPSNSQKSIFSSIGSKIKNVFKSKSKSKEKKKKKKIILKKKIFILENSARKKYHKINLKML